MSPCEFNPKVLMLDTTGWLGWSLGVGYSIDAVQSCIMLYRTVPGFEPVLFCFVLFCFIAASAFIRLTFTPLRNG
ncbi:hypothetical protein EX30DRAFT_342547 [Ascodesmis nigricans]|uniref:Uncharacterized protein n=1 Tax=Ascodesmis nigricans TaxID=341454 RepID=A0A4S2MSP5_9PEZI|nr:hypothetical protein EX30DRAFT_342547 [Ascodesmis nigricans]